MGRHGTRTLRLRDERGITLAEVLMAVVIIGIGLVGLLTVVPISSFAVYEGNSLTTATFLANQKMEEVKNSVWMQIPANDCVGLSPGNGDFAPTSNACTRTNPTVCNAGTACTTVADETPVANYAGYNRTVRIVDCATVAGGCGGVTDANFRRVTVTVTYHAIAGTGTGAAGSVKPTVLSMNLSRR